MRIYFYALCSSCRLWQEAAAGPGHDAQKGSELSSGTSWQLAVEIGSRFPVRWAGLGWEWRLVCGGVARAAACLCVTLSHFCASLTNAAVHMLRTPHPPLDMHPHICIELYLLLVAVVPSLPLSPLQSTHIGS